MVRCPSTVAKSEMSFPGDPRTADVGVTAVAAGWFTFAPRRTALTPPRIVHVGFLIAKESLRVIATKTSHSHPTLISNSETLEIVRLSNPESTGDSG